MVWPIYGPSYRPIRLCGQYHIGHVYFPQHSQTPISGWLVLGDQVDVYNSLASEVQTHDLSAALEIIRCCVHPMDLHFSLPSFFYYNYYRNYAANYIINHNM